MIRALVNLIGWIVGGLIVGALLVAAYNVSPWILVIASALACASVLVLGRVRS